MAFVFAMVAAAGIVTADTEYVTVAAGGTEAQNLGSLVEGDSMTISWTSLQAVSAVITGPSGYSESYSSSTYGWDLIEIPHDGAYTITFTNAGATSAEVTLTWDVIPFSAGGLFDDLLTIMLIILVIVIVVIVLIVVLVVVVGGKKKKQAAMAAGAPPGLVTPTTPGMCPVCGTQTDTNAQFCAKCGARFR